MARELREAVQSATGQDVLRLRIRVDPEWVSTIDYFSTAVVGSSKWLWPDEVGYDGPVFEPIPISRSDHWEYAPSTPSSSPVGSSLARIRDWLAQNAPEILDQFNPPASVGQIAEFEQTLEVTLPSSVSDAWMVHDGQHGDAGVVKYRWLSTDESMEQLRWFRNRPDGGAGMIPVLAIDGHIGYVESVDSSD